MQEMHVQRNDGFLYTCDECEHKVKWKYSLKVHMANKHDGEQFHCDRCEYKSAFKENLKT